MSPDADRSLASPSLHLVPEDQSRLHQGDAALGADGPAVAGLLRQDRLVLLRGIDGIEAAEKLLGNIASAAGLLERLKLQATFASIQGHRSLIGRYFMSVNRRGGYQFIPPHSEGDAKAAIQMGCLFCVQNTTDGGDTLLFNTNRESAAWDRLRCVTTKVDPGSHTFAPREIATLRAMHGIMWPQDLLKAGAKVLSERPGTTPGTRLCRVLAPLAKARSSLLDQDVPAYWDNVSSIDAACGIEFMHLLRQCGLLKEPTGGAQLPTVDVDHASRRWRSGVRLADLFSARITHRLQPGEMLVFNNFTWAHAASNWTPNSGTRTVLAAFA